MGKLILKLQLLYCLICSTTLSQLQIWDEQRDDLSEYKLLRSATGVRSEIECATLAQSEHQAVEFSAPDGTCRMYSCLLGWSGCRKCRNARNSSLAKLQLRRVDELGHTCWRTFQHRVDDSVDFYRNWSDYVSGFGQGEDRNYWMGLEALHQMTKTGERRVRWEMSLWNGSWYWWEDTYFRVQNSTTNYQVSVGDQDVNRSNIVRRSSGGVIDNQQFSTPDRDHDQISGSCAVRYHGAWWYDSCHSYNPNGIYFTPPLAFNLSDTLWADGITVSTALPNVYPFAHTYSMMTFECLVSFEL